MGGADCECVCKVEQGSCLRSGGGFSRPQEVNLLVPFFRDLCAIDGYQYSKGSFTLRSLAYFARLTHTLTPMEFYT